MDLTAKIRAMDLQSSILSGSAIRPRLHPIPAQSNRFHLYFSKKSNFTNFRIRNPTVSARIATEAAVSEAEAEPETDFESLFSQSLADENSRKHGKKKSNSGASSISSGIKLENVSKSFKGVTVLKDVSWEVKKGEKVGLVGVNGAGKTTQLRIIAGLDEPDSGNLIKAKDNMKIAFLSQEFEVCPSRTVKEEFLMAFKEEMEVAGRLEKVQKALEGSVEDLELMGRLLDELDLLQRRARDVDLDAVEVKINRLMPELGFAPEDSDRLVASFSGGWQMRMCLGKILLQEPDLLLLDEPTNHLDLDTIEWLEGYLQTQAVPMVIISHDRAFLDQLCTKIVETDMGVSRTFVGNYSEYVLAKATWIEAQYAAWEKQQKEIEHTRELISRLGAGANSGRASSEAKKLEKLLEEEKIEKPFIRKQIKFRFPERGRSGRTVLMIKNIQFGYGDKMLFTAARRPSVLENLLEISALLLPDHLPYALKIFSLASRPHTEAYNILIRAFNLTNSPHDSFLLLRQMLLDSVHPDKHTLSCVLKACSRLGSLARGKLVHSHVLKCGFGHEDFVLNSLIHMYASCGEVGVARMVFDGMPYKGVVTWNAMFAGYFKAGDWEDVVELFRGMLELGAEFDEVTLISVLTACGRLGVLDLGEWIDGYVRENVGVCNRNLMTSLVDMYAKCGRVDRARELFDEMPCHDVVAWSAMISGYNQWNRCREALELFHKMQRADVEPNEVTMVSVLSSCAVLGALETGKWVHSYVRRKGMKVTVNLGTALVDFYAKCGCIESALDAFKKMPQKNSWSWTVLIQGLASNGQGREALKYFSSMLGANLEPNDVTFVAVLSACSHAGLVEEGRYYFDSMSRDHGIEPRVEHYGCMADVLGRAGLVGEAYDFIRRMPTEPNAIIWRTLLSACKIHKNVEIGEESLKQIALLEPRHSGDYILLSNIYASVGRRRDAVRVRDQMKEEGIKKIPGCSLMELDGTIYEFFAEDRAHPESATIYEKVEEMVVRIKEAGYVPNVAEGRLDAEEGEKEVSVSHHSEKLAIAFGLIRAPPGAAIRVSKNLRVCTDCHTATKLISKVYGREIIVRDRNRFHHFKDGSCSCNDYW